MNRMNSKKIFLKQVIGMLLIASLSQASLAHCKEGLSIERQAELISSLESYEPLDSIVDSSQKVLKVPDETAQRINKICDQEEYSTDKYCLERRYMNDGYYIVRISFRRDEAIPVEPPSPYILGSNPLRIDSAARDAFLNEWSEKIASEYLGNNYRSFHSV